MDHHRSHELWLAEQETVRKLRAERPELNDYVGEFQHQDILHHIGITTIPVGLPIGYIRFRPEDFIVEEIDTTGKLATIEPESTALIAGDDRRTLYCQLIKIGIATPEALDRLSIATGIDRRRIGYAGLKDAGAVTSQNISLRGSQYETVHREQIENVLLKRFRYGSGTIANGDLRGNRFTLTIRTEQPIEQAQLDDYCRHLSKGVVNFYGPQRFGNRWLSHYFGRYVLRGQYEKAVISFLTDVNAGERKYIGLVRQSVRERSKDWAFSEEAYSVYPYSFQHELTVVRYLHEHPDDWLGALSSISEQTRLWIYAYMSWLVNQTMSDLTSSGQQLPRALPVPLSTQVNDQLPYRGLLEQDGLSQNFVANLRPLPFIRPQTRYLETIVVPKFHGQLTHPIGCVLSFDLPAGAYATTMLMNLFTLESGQPAPSWIKPDELDAKELLGTGSIQQLKRQYGQYFTVKDISENE
ncbi:MAG: tRNA pseudouridine(13) synthase TruD [Patescibacteria group bacterium]